jgi:hypothetical protein
MHTMSSAFARSKIKLTEWYAKRFNPLTIWRCFRFFSRSLKIAPIIFAGIILRPTATTDIKAIVDVCFA